MPHPYFESTSFPWPRPDAQVFYDSLHRAVSNVRDIDHLYKSCSDGLPALTQGIPPHQIWTEALDILAARQLIRRLCELLRDTRPEIKAQVMAVFDAQDAIDRRLLSGDRMFFDRMPLRSQLVELSANGGLARVLLVRGERHSGKTWTRHLVEEQARSRGEGCTYLGEGMVATVREVIERLFTDLGGTMPDQFETTPAYYRKVCNKLQEAARNGKRRWWIVADDLNTDPERPTLDSEIRSFFNQMTLSMANPAFSDWFRLILIDYPDGKPPTNWKRGDWSEDWTKRADAKSEVISAFLLDWATRKGKHLTEDNANQLAADLIAKVDDPAADAASRLERIYDELIELLKGLQ